MKINTLRKMPSDVSNTGFIKEEPNCEENEVIIKLENCYDEQHNKLQPSEKGDRNQISYSSHEVKDELDNEPNLQQPMPFTSEIESTTEVKSLPTNEEYSSITRLPSLKYHQDTNSSDKLVRTKEQLFPCYICKQSFNRISHLKRHQFVHSKDTPFTYDKCNGSFNTKRNLTCYQDTRNKSLFSCDICKQRFNRKPHLLRHQLVHTKDKAFCNVTGIKIDLERHQQVNNEERAQTCGDGDKIFATKFPCKCGKKFSDKESLTQHKCVDKKSKKEQFNLEKIFSCDVCDKGFNTSYRLERHKRMHRVRKPFLCEICKKSFANVSILTNHKKRVHKKPSNVTSKEQYVQEPMLVSHEYDNSEENPLKCDISEEQLCHIKEELLECDVCNENFNTKSELLSHQCVNNEEQIICNDEKEFQNYNETFSSKEKTLSIKEEPKTPERVRVAKSEESHSKSNSVCTNEQKFTESFSDGKTVFSCIICAKQYSRKQSVIVHHRTHTDNKPYSCNVCSKQFIVKAFYKEHLIVHTDEKPFECNLCHQQFKHKSALVLHLKRHNRQNICDICKMKFNTRLELRQHRLSHIESLFPCSTCPKKFISQSCLDRHRLIHAGNRPFPCSFCPKEFIVKFDLLRHMRKHTGEKPYTCDICKKEFANRSCVIAHLRMHSSRNESNTQKGAKTMSKDRKRSGYVCDICNLRFTSKESFNSHKRNHAGVKPVLCDVSDQRYNWKSDKPFSCDVCEKGFPYKSKLDRHRRVHTGEKPISCDVCHSSFTDTSNLRYHIKKVHLKIKPLYIKGEFFCNLCKKHLTDKELSTHDCVRNEEETSNDDSDKKIGGNITDYQISLLRGLLVTRRSKKKGDKQPFLCYTCGKRFVNNYRLTRHMRTHTREKPYSCDVCSKSFSDRSAMVKHRKRVHKIKTTPGSHKKIAQNLNPVEQLTQNPTLLIKNDCDEQKPLLPDSNNTPEESQSVYIKLEFSCNVCKKYFTHKSELMSHHCVNNKKSSTSKEEIFNEEDTFSKKEELFPNEKDIVSKEEETFTNEEDTFSDQFPHSAEPTHQDVGEEFYPIIKTEETVPRSIARNDEEKLKHRRTTPRRRGDKIFICDTCGKDFTLKNSLVKHIRIHNRREKLFYCNICNKKFLQKSYLIRHMPVHTGVKEYSCFCGNTYYHRSSLHVHQRIHRDEKPYSCDVCKRQFSIKAHLTEHLRVHSGEKPFMCHICDYKCAQTSALKSHLRTHVKQGVKNEETSIGSEESNRTNIAPPTTPRSAFVCDVCGKQFQKKYCLQVHQNTHLENKPFPCELCKKQYAEKHGLLRHMRSHTGEKPYLCEVCNKRFRHRTGFVYHQRKCCSSK